MEYKFSDFKERNTNIPEVKAGLKSIESQIETISNHSFCLPFESEPSEFIKFLSVWKFKKNQPEDNDG